METNECFICGNNNFTIHNGAFVCNECGIQSQVNFNEIIKYLFCRIIIFNKKKINR